MATELTVPDPARAREFFQAKMQFTTGPIELDRFIRETAKVNVVDVRYTDDYAKGQIPGAVNLPKDKWSSFDGLRKDQINVVYCYTQTCHLAAEAALFFASNGYPVMELEGGFAAWKAADLPVRVEQKPAEKPMQ